MASQFELLAALIDEDRFFMEVDEYGFGDLLKKILRTCHDLNSPKHDATWVADMVAAHITGWMGVKHWPEDEGEGLADWDKLDALDTSPISKSAVEEVE